MTVQDILSNEELRQHEFPVTREKIYLAHAAVCPLPRRVAEAVAHYAMNACDDDQETGIPSAPTTTGISFDTLHGIYINNTTDQALGTFNFAGASSGLNSYTLALTAGLISDALNGDALTLRLFAADNSISYLFSSRSNGSVPRRPTLVIVAVPEPGALPLIAIGLAGLMMFRRQFVTKSRTPLPH